LTRETNPGMPTVEADALIIRPRAGYAEMIMRLFLYHHNYDFSSQNQAIGNFPDKYNILF